MITFDGFTGGTIITAAEGIYKDLVLGHMQQEWNFKRLIRTDGELAFPRGRAGCDHTFTVVFLDVPVASVGSIRARIDSLAASDDEGDLTFPDWGEIPNCVCTGVVPATATRAVIIAWGSGVLSETKTYNMEFALTFRQLRA